MDQLASPDVLNLIYETTNLINININESLLKFLAGMRKAGSGMKNKRNITVGKRTTQAWFDAECRVIRIDLPHHLRKYHKCNTDYQRLQYNQKRNEYNELLRLKRTTYRKS